MQRRAPRLRLLVGTAGLVAYVAMQWWGALVLPARSSDEGRRTRLVFRWRSRTTPAWMTVLAQAAIVPADAIMSRGMLRGLAARVERAAQSRTRS